MLRKRPFYTNNISCLVYVLLTIVQLGNYVKSVLHPLFLACCTLCVVVWMLAGGPPKLVCRQPGVVLEVAQPQVHLTPWVRLAQRFWGWSLGVLGVVPSLAGVRWVWASIRRDCLSPVKNGQGGFYIPLKFCVITLFTNHSHFRSTVFKKFLSTLLSYFSLFVSLKSLPNNLFLEHHVSCEYACNLFLYFQFLMFNAKRPKTAIATTGNAVEHLPIERYRVIDRAIHLDSDNSD